MSGERICAKCGARVMLGLCGYTHADGPDKHTPTPVRRVDADAVFGHVSRGTKRASGAGALFTRGDGRGAHRPLDRLRDDEADDE